MNKVWDEMSTDDRLEWLRDRIHDLQRAQFDTASASSANRALAGSNAKIERIAKDLEELKQQVQELQESTLHTVEED